jgi:cyanate lyase
MVAMKPIAHWLEQKEVSLADLVETTGLDRKVVDAIVAGQYTPSPAQRQALAGALDVEVGDIAWGHTVPVQHLYGHGPQFGRSP